MGLKELFTAKISEPQTAQVHDSKKAQNYLVNNYLVVTTSVAIHT